MPSPVVLLKSAAAQSVSYQRPRSQALIDWPYTNLHEFIAALRLMEGIAIKYSAVVLLLLHRTLGARSEDKVPTARFIAPGTHHIAMLALSTADVVSPICEIVLDVLQTGSMGT